MSSRRGQLSIETMIIYGLIALVALAAVAALIYFDVLNLGRYLPDTCDLGAADDMTCDEWRVSGAGGKATILITNQDQRAITITKVCLDDGGTYFESTACKDYTGTTGSIAPGSSLTVVIASSKLTSTSKGSVNAKITTTYTPGQLEQVAVGKLRAKITA